MGSAPQEAHTIKRAAGITAYRIARDFNTNIPVGVIKDSLRQGNSRKIILSKLGLQRKKARLEQSFSLRMLPCLTQTGGNNAALSPMSLVQ